MVMGTCTYALGAAILYNVIDTDDAGILDTSIMTTDCMMVHDTMVSPVPAQVVAAMLYYLGSVALMMCVSADSCPLPILTVILVSYP